jgi:peptide chain release factor 1
MQEKESVIVEIRAGQGGNEAGLFANDLFRMYSKYAQAMDWKQKTLDSRPTEIGGVKEIIFELRGIDVVSKMENEAGVHRVQRVPHTEKEGRVHTSTASVAVLLKPKTTEITIKTEDLKIDTFRASGPGGQNVNKRETAIRLTHIPSGIVVSSQSERNQLQNKENAISILQARLLQRQQTQAMAEQHGKRKAQIGWAKRPEKIRTYNFPQDRLTDHRIKKSWHNLEKIMSGKLDKVITIISKKLTA